MKLTKRQLKKIIREEYSRLKRRGLIKESWDQRDSDRYDFPDDQGGWPEEVSLSAEILELAGRPDGVSLDELNTSYDAEAFDKVDELCEAGSCWLDDMEGIVYASDSEGAGPAQDRYVNY